ncbi:MAG: VOC family protein [Bdellovibrionales bacterium]|nr:VOC family protein [Bdellovibrionales bacterium]
MFDLKFDHFGLAVKYPSKAENFLSALGYIIDEEVYDPLQKVNLKYATHQEMPAVELVYKSNEAGPLENILNSRSELIYHTCYRTKNLEKTLNILKENKLRFICVSPPKPAILFNGLKVSFYMIQGFGLIEIIEDN